MTVPCHPLVRRSHRPSRVEQPGDGEVRESRLAPGATAASYPPDFSRRLLVLVNGGKPPRIRWLSFTATPTGREVAVSTLCEGASAVGKGIEPGPGPRSGAEGAAPPLRSAVPPAEGRAVGVGVPLIIGCRAGRSSRFAEQPPEAAGVVGDDAVHAQPRQAARLRLLVHRPGVEPQARGGRERPLPRRDQLVLQG